MRAQLIGSAEKEVFVKKRHIAGTDGDAEPYIVWNILIFLILNAPVKILFRRKKRTAPDNNGVFHPGFFQREYDLLHIAVDIVDPQQIGRFGA